MNVRPFTEADASTIAGFINADDERFFGRPGRFTGADILRFLQYAKETWVWEEDDRVVASGMYGVHGNAVNIRGTFSGEARALHAEVLDRGEAFAHAEGANKILTGAAEPDSAARRLFESRGYREARRFYEMAVELTEEPVAPVVPDGLLLDELHEDEYRAFYDALNEAFADHWEWHPQPWDEWFERRRGQHRDGDGPIWFVIRDGEELAAVTRNDLSIGGGGYVGAIGVRPAWRGRGLAKALLQRTFAEFWRRGTPRVTLDVDSQNETGAVALYERVGMHIEKCGVVFEKEIE